MDNQPQNINNKTQTRFQDVNNIILNNESFLVAADGNSFDSMAAAAAFALMLQSVGKQVVAYSSVAIESGKFTGLSGLDSFSNQVQSDSNKLLISFNCPLDAIEKVSSNDEGEKLNLTVEFKPEAKVVEPSSVNVKKAGPEFVAGFLIGIDFPFASQPSGDWVWFSKSGQQQAWARVNFVEKKASYSESVASILSRTKMAIPVSSADNLFLGIKSDTNNFESADSIALETAAYCLRIKEEASKNPAKVSSPAQMPAPETPINKIESKESPVSGGGFSKPPIFTGATTPKV